MSREVFISAAGISVLAADLLLKLVRCLQPNQGVMLLIASTGIAHAELYFDPALLDANASQIGDLSYFSQGNDLTPGRYDVEVWRNKERLSRYPVMLVAEKSGTLTPCFTAAQIEELGIKLTAFPEMAEALKRSECQTLSQWIPQSDSSLDVAHLRLDVSIPQIAMNPALRGVVPVSRWDNGITALMLNYNFSGANSSAQQGRNHDDYFLNLRSSFNTGPWRLYNNSVWRYNGAEGQQWQTLSSYLERPIVPLRASVVAGESFTKADLFDSFSFRGVQLTSDETMLPDSQRGFAPEVRGIAKSYARVTVKQNNSIIYQTWVAPGAFSISDLYSGAASGDLMVTVTEADGSENSYAVPYSMVPVLQRDGQHKFAFMAGQYAESQNQKRSLNVGQASWFQGMPYGFTLFGGALGGNNYQSVAIGTGRNMGQLGALSMDVNHARSQLVDGSQHQGQSWRLRYAKSLNQTGTWLQVLASRYSTQGFYTLNEVASDRMRGQLSGSQDQKDLKPGYDFDLSYNKKSQLQLGLTQNLKQLGSVYTSLNRQTYWRSDKTSSFYQVGFSTMVGQANLNLAWGYNKSPWQPRADQQISISLSLPLDRLLGQGRSTHPIYLTADNTTNSQGASSSQLGVSGSLLEDSNLNYSLRQGYSNHYRDQNSTASLDYQGRFGNVNAAYARSADSQVINYGASGGVVVHSQGLVLSQPLGETNVLVDVGGASGVSLENAAGVKTNWGGYAVIPYASQYRQNRIALNTSKLDDRVEIDEPVTDVVPTKGALVRARFKARTGDRVLMTLMHRGKPVPFGAQASVLGAESDNNSIVGEGGTVYFAGLQPEGTIVVSWGDAAHQKCQVRYRSATKPTTQSIVQLSSECTS